MNIQELSMEHIEDIKKLMLDVFSGNPWNDRWTDERLHAYIFELIGSNNSLSFGIYQDDALMGMALGRIKSWYEGDEYWIEEFGIHPEMQQHGIGSKFMDEIEKKLMKKNVVHIVLLTERKVPAYHFYKKRGFKEKEESVFFVKFLR